MHTSFRLIMSQLSLLACSVIQLKSVSVAKPETSERTCMMEAQIDICRCFLRCSVVEPLELYQL